MYQCNQGNNRSDVKSGIEVKIAQTACTVLEKTYRETIIGSEQKKIVMILDAF